MLGVPIRRSLAVLGAVIAIGLMPANACSDSEESIQAEAGCVINLSRFIEWPSSAFQSVKAPFVIDIVGENPFGFDLARLASQTLVAGRAIEVRQLRPRDDPRACQLLFIGSAEQKVVTQILASLNGSSVLTVSDADGFLDWGGMVQFSRSGGQVRFAVNDGAIKSAGIRASANLLKTASKVIEGTVAETN
jgi:hypothetical protein